MTRPQIIETILFILRKQGREFEELADGVTLREIGFRSLDFSELCLRVEEEIGRELNFAAAALRRIETVGDVCDFVELASNK